MIVYLVEMVNIEKKLKFDVVLGFFFFLIFKDSWHSYLWFVSCW